MVAVNSNVYSTRSAGKNSNAAPSYDRNSAEFVAFTQFMNVKGAKMDLEERALVIASFAHHGQTDHSGVDYIHHPNAAKKLLVGLAEYNRLSETQKLDARIAVQLHDVLEDTVVTVEDLHSWGISADQLNAIVAVTAGTREPKKDYYARIVEAGPVAVCVKLADLAHNTSPARREDLPGSPSRPVNVDGQSSEDLWSRLGRKYYHAYVALGVPVPAHLVQFKPEDA